MLNSERTRVTRSVGLAFVVVTQDLVQSKRQLAVRTASLRALAQVHRDLVRQNRAEIRGLEHTVVLLARELRLATLTIAWRYATIRDLVSRTNRQSVAAEHSRQHIRILGHAVCVLRSDLIQMQVGQACRNSLIGELFWQMNTQDVAARVSKRQIRTLGYAVCVLRRDLMQSQLDLTGLYSVIRDLRRNITLRRLHLETATLQSALTQKEAILRTHSQEIKRLEEAIDLLSPPEAPTCEMGLAVMVEIQQKYS